MSEIENKDIITDFPDVNRVEVIDDKGRAYVNMDARQVQLSFQDRNRTIKIFLANKSFVENLNQSPANYDEINVADVVDAIKKAKPEPIESSQETFESVSKERNTALERIQVLEDIIALGYWNNGEDFIIDYDAYSSKQELIIDGLM